jgi:hypothetical protein
MQLQLHFYNTRMGKRLHRLPNIDTDTIVDVGLDIASPIYSLPCPKAQSTALKECHSERFHVRNPVRRKRDLATNASMDKDGIPREKPLWP